MEAWEAKYICDNLSELIRLTSPISDGLLADLKKPGGIFSEYDKQVVKCGSQIPIENANRLFELAVTKLGAYDELTDLFSKHKISGAADILLRGYQINNKPVPVEWIFCEKPDSLERKYWLFAAQSIKFKVQDAAITMKELLGDNSENETHRDLYKRIYQSVKDKRCTKPLLLIKYEAYPKPRPAYYIPRTLCLRNQIKTAIFSDKSTKSHIFLVEGISEDKLLKISDYDQISTSGVQRHEVNVRFIILEDEHDFEDICKIAADKVVHVIQYKRSDNDKDNAYFWVKSNKFCRSINNFLEYEWSTVGEDEIVNHIDKFNTRVFSIADSAGMGKTLLLGNLARKFIGNNRIVLFIVFQEFLEHLRNKSTESSELILDAILEYTCTNPDSKDVCKEIVKCGRFKLVLFLDGYDEVSELSHPAANTILGHIMNLRDYIFAVFVSTRVRERKNLENVLKLISYEICPFNEENQIEFLTKYWTEMTKGCPTDAINETTFTELARACLKILEKNISDMNEDIAGIPLHCMLLAETYADEALRISRNTQLKFSLQEFSIYLLYKNLIEKKFSKAKITKESTDLFVKAHVRAAIKLVFPQWMSIFGAQIDPCKKADQGKLYSIGIMEKSAHANSTRFIHRTLAEFMMTQYFVENVNKCKNCIDVIVRRIIGKRQKVMSFSRCPRYHLYYPTMSYFLNFHFKNFLQECRNQYILSNLSYDIISFAAVVCCDNDLRHCFNFTTKLILAVDNRSEDWIARRDNYFKHMPHFIVRSSKDVGFLKDALTFTEQIFGVGLNYHVYQSEFTDQFFPWIQGCTPIHMAVYQGRLNMVAYFRKAYKVPMKSLHGLMHYCLQKSGMISASVIKNKLLIMKLLADLKPECVNERHMGIPPLLCYSVNLNLLKELVELGANINSFSDNGTVLHGHSISVNKSRINSCKNNSYTELVSWAFEKGFTLVDYKDSNGRTPLMTAQHVLTGEALDLFCKAGANFNVEDRSGNTLLFYLLRLHGEKSTITKVVNCGGNINHVNAMNENAAHILIRSHRSTHDILDMLKHVCLIGFTRLNEVDANGYSPLHDQVTYNSVADDKLLQFFRESGADFNATTIFKESVLFCAIECNIGKKNAAEEIISSLISFGVNLYHCVDGRLSWLTLANKSNHHSALRIILGKFNRTWKDKLGCTALHHLLKQKFNNCSALQCFKEVLFDFNAVDNNGWSVLFYAINFEQTVECFSRIVEYGGDLHYRNEEEQTALHIAVLSLNYSATRYFLLNKFFDLNFKDKNGCSPYDYYIHLRDKPESHPLQPKFDMLFSRHKNCNDFDSDHDRDSITAWLSETNAKRPRLCFPDEK